jgi:hypothetical protein
MKFTSIFLLAYFCFSVNLYAKHKSSNNSNSGTILVSNYGAIPDDGIDDAQAIRDAIAAAIALNSPQIVLFNAGRYDLKVGGNSAYIRLLNANSIILRGATINNEPATKLVRFNNAGENGSLLPILQIRFSKNIKIENFILDNDPYYYTAGTVTVKTSTSVTVDVLADHPMNIFKPYIMGVYDKLNNKNKKLRITWDTGLPTWNPISGGSGRLLRLDFQALADEVAVGDDVFWFQGNHGGAQCVTGKSENISFTNVITNNATGFVYHFVDNNNVTLERVKIEPVGNRIAVSPRDGIHFAHCTGLISLNNVVVKNTPGDDGLNVRGDYLSVGAISSRTITFAENLVADLKVNSRIQFLDAQFQPIWTGTVESAMPEIANNTPVTVVLKETPPSWIVQGTIASPLGWIPKSFIVKNSIFENTGRFGIIAKTNNVVIDSSIFRFNGNAGVVFGSSYGSIYKEAQSPWNVVVKNSSFENNIQRMGVMGPSGIMVDQLFIENANINGNMFFSNNTFKDETHAYTIRDAMNVHLWGNVYNNVTTPILRNLSTTSNFTQSVVYTNFVTDDLAKGAISYSETWPVSSNASDNLGTVTWNNQTGSFAEFNFVGNHISYYARKGQQMGKVDVYLDGNLVLDDFDLYSNITETKFLVFENINLQNTTHTLRIENTGLKNSNSTGNYVNIDYLLYKQGNIINNTVLPITLLDFYGKAQSRDIKLFWQTTQEINNSHFEILKLNNTYKFTPIGEVKAKTIPLGINNYSFIDSKPNKGSNYYELKQYDLDGKSSTSKTIEVNFSFDNTFSIYPNPVKAGDNLNMTLLNFDNQLDIELVDMNQKVVLKKHINQQQNSLSMSTKGLIPGVYILKLNSDKQQFVTKVVIVP